MKEFKMFERAAAFDKGICKNHTGKMEGMWSYSTPCTTNKFCKAYSSDPSTVCAHCYAQSQLSYQHTTEAKCIRNEDVVKGSLMNDCEMPVLLWPYFRWESFGDVDDVFQAANYIKISAANPNVKFGWFTKNPFILKMAFEMFNLDKPENLIIIASSKYLNVCDTKLADYWFVDHVFTVYTKEYAMEHNIVISCGGRHCYSCLNCYDKTKKAPFYINELLK